MVTNKVYTLKRICCTKLIQSSRFNSAVDILLPFYNYNKISLAQIISFKGIHNLSKGAIQLIIQGGLNKTNTIKNGFVHDNTSFLKLHFDVILCSSQIHLSKELHPI